MSYAGIEYPDSHYRRVAEEGEQYWKNRALAAEASLKELRAQIAKEVEEWLQTPPQVEAFDDPELVAFIRGDSQHHQEGDRH